MNKGMKFLLGVGSILLVAFLVAGLFAGNLLYNLALNPRADKSKVYTADHNSLSTVATTSDPAHSELKEMAKLWRADFQMENHKLESRDKLLLDATAFTQESNLWAILCHGYGGSNKQNTIASHQFFEQGYNVLLPNARGHGESEGSYIGMGWDDRLDIVDWIEYILKQDENAEIVLYGVSMGAATVMMASGEDLPTNVRAIVEDCGYTSVWDEFSYQLQMLFHIPASPVMNFASLVTKARAGWWIETGNAVEQVAKSKTPMMFIHGDSDTFVPAFMLDQVYEAASVPKEKLLVEGAGHGMAASVLGAEYWDSVFAFISLHLTDAQLV